MAANLRSFLRPTYHQARSLFQSHRRPSSNQSNSSQPTMTSPNPVKTIPLKSVAEMKNWRPESTPPHGRPSALVPRAAIGGPQVILCHDMMGNYGVDAIHQTDFSSVQQFTFHYWQFVDIFIYFSHDRCTIPPPQWIDSAHRQGVKVLGTFITEWEDGKVDQRNMLERDAQGGFILIKQFVEIMAHFRFDGWFINLEAALDNEDVASDVVLFLAELKEAMHKKVPGSLLIWYDSVTRDGRLAWQNELNFKNKPFFDNTDGIFTNYTWKAHQPTSSAEAAGSRRWDVYSGIDCFGRNTFGGGGYDTWKAIDVCVKAETSVAIFAPGWAWEVVAEKGLKDFFAINQKLWASDTGSVAGFIEPRPVASTTNFVTAFNRGTGKAFYHQGKLIKNARWFDLSLQQPQPSWPSRLHLHESNHLDNVPRDWYTIISDDDAYEGGSHLSIVVLQASEITLNLPVFKLNQQDVSTLQVTFSGGDGCDFAIALQLQGAESLFAVSGTWEGQVTAGQTVPNSSWQTSTFDVKGGSHVTQLNVRVRARAPTTIKIGKIELIKSVEEPQQVKPLINGRTVTWSAPDGIHGVHVISNGTWQGFTIGEVFVLENEGDSANIELLPAQRL